MGIVLSRKSGGGSSSGGGAPSGPAGGDLSGTYPNPTVTNLIPKTLVDAKGDLLVATAADTVARKAVGATNGMMLSAQSAQADGLLWALPPGLELDYVQITTPVTVTATSAATATTCITGSAVVYDGATRVCIEAYSPQIQAGSTGGSRVYVMLYDGAAQVGIVGVHAMGDGRVDDNVHFSRIYRTPSAASHTFSVRAYREVVDGFFGADAGGDGLLMPAYIRITKT